LQGCVGSILHDVGLLGCDLTTLRCIALIQTYIEWSSMQDRAPLFESVSHRRAIYVKTNYS